MKGNSYALGTEAMVLNRDNLLSALGRPYHGYHVEIHEKVAALIHAIILNHPFVDGNKRTAVYLAEALLNRSGYKLTVDDLVLYDKFILIAKGDLDYDELLEWMRSVIEPS